ncbi:unnamed protein product, partial [Pylaiella littoralis]
VRWTVFSPVFARGGRVPSGRSVGAESHVLELPSRGTCMMFLLARYVCVGFGELHSVRINNNVRSTRYVAAAAAAAAVAVRVPLKHSHLLIYLWNWVAAAAAAAAAAVKVPLASTAVYFFIFRIGLPLPFPFVSGEREREREELLYGHARLPP